MELFSPMWDVLWRRIIAAKKPTDLTPGATSVHWASNRAGPKTRQFKRIEISRILGQKDIKPAATEWAAPTVLAFKKDCILFFCVDRRWSPSATHQGSFHKVKMDKSIDSAADLTLYSLLDANTGHWRVKMDEENKCKNAFISHRDLSQITRMLFGLKIAPGIL